MKVGLVSLGCPKNLVDSEVMLGLVREAGHELTHDPSRAEALIVNTCAFIDSAKQESIEAILELVRQKRDGACRRLIVTGCLAERYREELRAEIPEIDALVGTGEVPEIVDALSGSCTGSVMPPTAPLRLFGPRGSPLAIGRGRALTRDPPHATRESPRYIYDAETPRVLSTPPHYAYVKVAEGCDYSCAFCIIPTLRGSYRSRPADSIVREARALAARGVRELLLVSQDTTFYGNDRGERGSLARLLGELNRVDGLEWIRLLYLYPTTIGDGTLAAIAEHERVCKYIDVPLQHASNPVLKRMRRPGSRQAYDRLLARIRDRVPGVALRTTFIVGFPGETRADVDELCRFVADHAFDHVGVFTYSHEEGTRAYTLDDDVPRGTKEARRSRVMRLQQRLVRARQRRRIGERTRMLVDGRASEHELVITGRLATQAPEIDGCVYLTECDPADYRAGDLVEVEITGFQEYDSWRDPEPALCYSCGFGAWL